MIVQKRTPLGQRVLPPYTRANEIANMSSHIVGAAFGLVVLILAITISLIHRDFWALAGGVTFGLSMVTLYCVSSIYHGLRPCMGKKVMQVIDHCTIYFLIVGTYTPILLCALRPAYPRLAWFIFATQWILALFGGVFTAIDLNRYSGLSMLCYLGMGWLIILAARPTYLIFGKHCFLWILTGGISYTLGAILYGIGNKHPSMHTVFHIFVLFGSLLHAIAILFYII